MSHRKSNIIVDIDGVIADDSIQNWMEKIRKKYPRFHASQVTPSPFMYDIEKFTGLPTKEALGMFHESVVETEPKILPECLDALNRIRMKHNLYIVTSRDRILEKATYQWLYKNGIQFKQLIFATGGKAYVAESLMADLAIDDNIGEYVNKGEFPKQVLIYDRPWNFSFNLNDNFSRVFNWYNIMEVVGETEELECLM
jgi:uncharacterized HAD superfamily protein